MKIEVQKVPVQGAKRPSLDILSEFCYYYPQYKLHEARALPAIHVWRLLKTAQRLEAARYLTLTQIVAAPHSDKGKAVNKLIQHFERIAKNG